MGIDHTYRYVDATAVYNKGKSDGAGPKFAFAVASATAQIDVQGYKENRGAVAACTDTSVRCRLGSGNNTVDGTYASIYLSTAWNGTTTIRKITIKIPGSYLYITTSGTQSTVTYTEGQIIQSTNGIWFYID